MSANVSIVTCKNYDPASVYPAVHQAVALLGGMSSFVSYNARVLVKPNLLMTATPEQGITTHPEVVRAVIKLLKDLNCKIIVGDGPSVWGDHLKNLDELYARTGIKKVCEEEQVELVRFEKKRWRGRFPLSSWLDEVDCFINVPKFKTHNLTLLTGAVKNLFGFVSANYKTELHKNYFENDEFPHIVVEILKEAPPALTVIDGIVAMEGDGPATAGSLRQMNVVLASNDCVALDAVLAKIMGIAPFDVMTTRIAAGRGLGVGDMNQITLLGEPLERISAKPPFLLPSASMQKKIPKPIVALAKKLLKFYPCVERDKCIRCAACVKACPGKAISLGKKCAVIDYKKCISCFCCQEVCPAAAIKTKKSLLAKIAGF